VIQRENIEIVLSYIVCFAFGLITTALLIPPLEPVAPLMCPTNGELIDNLTMARNEALNQVIILETNLIEVQKNNTQFKDRCGSYNPNTGLITIETSCSKTYSATLRVLNHEWAHKDWFEKLSEYERLDWEEQFKTTDNFPNEYSKTTVKEYYAEMMSVV
jgi:hypothetical protein